MPSARKTRHTETYSTWSSAAFWRRTLPEAAARATRSPNRPDQTRDRLPDRRGQAVPVCDKLAKCRVFADSVQTGVWAVDATIMQRNKLRNGDFGCNSRVPHHFPTLSTRVPSDGLGSSQKFPFPKRPLAQWNEYRTAATEALSILIGAWPTKSTSPYLASEAVNPPASTQTQKPTVKIRRRRRPHAHRLRLIASHRDRPRPQSAPPASSRPTTARVAPP